MFNLSPHAGGSRRRRRRWPAAAAAVLLMASIGAIGTTSVAQAAVPPTPTGWSLVWSDDFNGASGSLPNEGNWRLNEGTSYPGGPPNWGTGEIARHTRNPANVSLDGGGNLRITPIRDGAGNWTSARIETNRADFKPPAGGTLRIESRIQMPNVTGDQALGYWPAFWALGSPYRGNWWNWPSIGEFDIMENVNGLNNVWGVLHCGVNPGGPCNETTGRANSRPCPGSSCQSAFHTYRFEWDRSVNPNQLRWYVDGQQFHSVSQADLPADTWSQMTDHAGYFIILNVAIGGAFPDALAAPTPRASTVSGRPMMVDYVAVWQTGGGTSPPPPPPPPGPPPPPPGPSPGNLALNRPATGSAPCASNEGPSQAVNGSVSGGNSDKFCSSATPKFLQVDLGSNQAIQSFVVKHAQAGGESASMNTRDFDIQVSGTGTSFTTVVQARGNTSAVTTHAVNTSGRYIRLNVINAEQSGTGGTTRIYEFEAYGSGSPTPPPPPPPPGPTPPPPPPGPAGTFPLILQNNTGGQWSNSQVYLTILGMMSPGEWAYLKPGSNGTWTHINYADTTAPGHLTKNGVNYPNMSFNMAQASTITMPTYTLGGRIYISLGSPVYIPVSPDNRGWGGPDLRNPNDPNNDVYWDFYEFTYVSGQISYGGNTTQVDQFSFPITSRLRQTASGYDNTVGINRSRASVLSGYQTGVSAPYRGLANQYRIVAPRTSNAFQPGGPQGNLMQPYIDQVWTKFTNQQWTQVHNGQTYSGRINGGVLTGTRGDGSPFKVAKPNSTHVFECSGPLALPPNQGGTDTDREVGRDFCAAFHRGVALEPSTWYNPGSYYASSPRDDYSAYLHSISLNNRAYAFAYDDVNDQSSVQILNNSNPPTSLTLGIGW